MEFALAVGLVMVAASVAAAVVAVSSARRAASFDITRDFDQLCQAVERLQKAGRSDQMKRVRAAALIEPPPPPTGPQPLTHDQLRALVARSNGVKQ